MMIKGSWICALSLLTFLLHQQQSPAQSSFLSLTTVHINVQYQPGISEDGAQKVADYLQSDYTYLSDVLGIDLKKRLEVRIYDSVGKYLTQTRQSRPWRGALYERGVLHAQPVSALVARGILEESLSYELAMAVLDQTSAKGCPKWLQQSFAVYHSGEMARLTPPIGARLSYFSDLAQDINQYPDPPEREDVHYILGSTMKFFVENYGEERAFRLFKGFNGITPIEDVFKKSFRAEFRSVERTWANFIASQTEPFRKRQ